MKSPVILRNNVYYLHRRVPVRYKAVEPRTFVRISLHTDSRVDATSRAGRGKADAQEAEAVLGGAQEPAITVSRALELYWTLAKDKTLKKSPDLGAGKIPARRRSRISSKLSVTRPLRKSPLTTCLIFVDGGLSAFLTKI